MTVPPPDSPAAGKTEKDEAFPVAWLLAPRDRPLVHAFYAFARRADDLADAPGLSPERRLAGLDRLAAGLAAAAATSPAGRAAWIEEEAGPDQQLAWRLGCLLLARSLPLSLAAEMLVAFRHDAAGPLWIEDEAQLHWYCRHSANPVGRFLLALHGEKTVAAEAASDALCTALQILNHLQGVEEDWYQLRRCYLPRSWCVEAGLVVTDSARAAGRETENNECFQRLFPPAGRSKNACPAPGNQELENLIQRGCRLSETLLARAEALPSLLCSPFLAAQAEATVSLARSGLQRLQQTDRPPGHRLPSRSDWALAGVRALCRGGLVAIMTSRPGKTATAPAASRSLYRSLYRQLRRCGSSFYWAIRLLPARQRQALTALYLFCRAVDDLADSPSLSATEKEAALAAWENHLTAASPPPPGADGLARVLTEARRDFALPGQLFVEIINGMRMDLPPGLCAPSPETLQLYCRRVAGDVGLLIVQILLEGQAPSPEIQAFALATGEALQYTNILRDVQEDLHSGRLYLPAPLLETAGLPASQLPSVLQVEDGEMARKLKEVWRMFASETQHRYDRAFALLADLPAARRKSLRCSVVMLKLYHDLFLSLQARGFSSSLPFPRPSRLRRAVVAVRAWLSG